MNSDIERLKTLILEGAVADIDLADMVVHFKFGRDVL
jgi:hypothetical protein